MATFLVRGGTVITDPTADPGWVADGAVCVADGVIAAVGSFAQLSAAFPAAPVHGDANSIVLPALINAHDHGRGVSPLSLGIDDDLLELWIVGLTRMPVLDARKDTALSALCQLKSGIATTVNSFYSPTNSRDALQAVLDGYGDAGIRAGIVYSAMDRPITATLLRLAAKRLPEETQRKIQNFLERRAAFDLPLYRDRREELRIMPPGSRNWLMTGVVSAHWSSEELLKRVDQDARRFGLAVQMHLLESRYQARDQSVVRHLAALGVLGPHVSCAHCVQLTASDIDVLARKGVSVVHNLSSNLRLRSGIAPVPAMLKAGVNVALGLDSMGLNDDADMFQEMRLVHRVHGDLSARQVLAMATVNGARALGLSTVAGTLTEGKRADVLVLDGNRFGGPGLTAPERVFDRVIHYATPRAVRDVFVAGEAVIRNGCHASLDEDRLVQEIRDGMAHPEETNERDVLLAEVAPTLRAILRPEAAEAAL